MLYFSRRFNFNYMQPECRGSINSASIPLGGLKCGPIPLGATLQRFMVHSKVERVFTKRTNYSGMRICYQRCKINYCNVLATYFEDIVL